VNLVGASLDDARSGHPSRSAAASHPSHRRIAQRTTLASCRPLFCHIRHPSPRAVAFRWIERHSDARRFTHVACGKRRSGFGCNSDARPRARPVSTWRKAHRWTMRRALEDRYASRSKLPRRMAARFLGASGCVPKREARTTDCIFSSIRTEQDLLLGVLGGLAGGRQHRASFGLPALWMRRALLFANDSISPKRIFRIWPRGIDDVQTSVRVSEPGDVKRRPYIKPAPSV
jgi:hypothetical protein